MAGPERLRIVILGGGFAGVHVARSLERGLRRAERRHVEVTLVSNENYMVFQPLLPEVVSGTLETLHVINPIRRLAPRTRLVCREVEAVDLRSRSVYLAPGFVPRPLRLGYDQLVICLGTRLGFERVPGASEHALPFKNLGDALRLRNEVVRVLEEADIEPSPEERRKLLTFVVAGGGFSGVECMAELHDFLRSAVRAYRTIEPEALRCILLQSGERILPELGAGLADYAHRILDRRGVEIRLGCRLEGVSADGARVRDASGDEQAIASRTVVSTVPAAPHPLLEKLGLAHTGGRIRVTPELGVPGWPGVWALGDCAAVPQTDGILSPPTAQHASRQARTCARNILADLRGRPRQCFAFTGLGSLASLGRRAAVADVLGVKLRGLVAWLAWRAIYLSKFPGLDRQVRIAVDWLLDAVLPRDITQLRIFAPEAIHHEHFLAGETVFAAGDFGNKLYVVLTGEAEIHRDGDVVATLGPESVFGEVALISDQPRNATVTARTDLEVLSVSRPAFKELAAHLPGTRSTLTGIMRSRGIDPGALDR